MKQFFLVGLGGFFGSIARYGLALAGQRWMASSFPAGTFVANVLGCFFIGLLIGLAGKTQWLGKDLYLLLAAGFCGGFTTFSSFSGENLQMLQNGEYAVAFSYTAASLAAGLAAAGAGVWLTR